MRNIVITGAIGALILAGSLLLWKTGESQAGKTATSEQDQQDLVLKGKAAIAPGTQEQGQSRLKNNLVEHRLWVPGKPPVNLYAGGIKVAVTFESDASPELENAIMHDLNLIFGHLESHEYMDARGAPELLIDGVLKHPDRFLKFTGKGCYFPSGLTGKIGFMNGDTMIVPVSVIKEYEEAWDRKAANEDKYSSLLAAIDQLNELVRNPIQDPHDWFFVSSSAQASGIELPDVTKDQFAGIFGGYRYRQPSLLDVFDGETWNPDLAGKLIARLYVFDSQGAIRNSMPPLIYTDGAWRFFIGHPPT